MWLKSSVLNASVLLSRGTITSRPKVRHIEGIPLPILHRTHADPISRLETVQSHFQTKGEN